MVIGFIGAGSMAGALARGLGEHALVTSSDGERAKALADQIGGEAVATNAELAERSDVVVLCHKPAQLEQVADEIDEKAKAVASTLAATSIATLEDTFPETPVYRLMPNIPVEVGRGVLCYVPGTYASEGPETELLQLLGRVGTVVTLSDEDMIEPAMAVMGCGPAFYAVVTEALAAAGARHGLDAAQSTRFAVETMAGTAAYLDANGLDAPALRRRVATPGGLTERGLNVLEDRHLRAAFDEAVDLVIEGSR